MTTQDCLAAIAAREAEVHAWVEVNPQPPLGDGPLNDWPFAAKDIFETRGLATEFGTPLFAGRRGVMDAALVTRLRTLGATLLGKTHTAAFAYFDPSPTCNPHAPGHTPGGSSSGSAAAVAAGMARFALGTQTAGSIIRPASYCGVVGFKPTFGLLPRDGVLPFSPSLDTMGLFTRDVASLAHIWSALGFAPQPEGERVLFVPARIDGVDDAMQAAFTASLARLELSVIPVTLPTAWQDMVDAVRRVQAYEGAISLRTWWNRYGERMGEKLAELIRTGLAMPQETYRKSLELLNGAATAFDALGVIATPAAPGAAPEGLASTGLPTLNSPWTGVGRPAITVPMPVAGLPMGLQLSAPRGADSALIAMAAHVESCLRKARL